MAAGPELVLSDTLHSDNGACFGVEVDNAVEHFHLVPLRHQGPNLVFVVGDVSEVDEPEIHERLRRHFGLSSSESEIRRGAMIGGIEPPSRGLWSEIIGRL